MKQLIRFVLVLLFIGSGAYAQVGRGKLTGAEFFIDNDPGPGLATALSLDGGIDNALRTALANQSANLTAGLHSLNVRLKDSTGLWSSPFKTTIAIENAAVSRTISAAVARAYWDNDINSAQLLTVFNGNPADALNQFINTTSSSLSTAGLHKINVQIYGANNAFSPVFTVAINVENQAVLNRVISASLARIYWDNNISGAENLILVNGSISDAVNSFLRDTTVNTNLMAGLHRLNVQMMDLSGGAQYGPVFTTTISVDNYQPSLSHVHLYEARVWFDNDAPPASGNMIALDGNFDSAFETFYQGMSPLPGGMHLMHVQLRDSSLAWGPEFKTTLSVENPISYRNIHISAMQMYWDNNSADSTVLIAFNNNYTEAMEVGLASVSTSSLTIGQHILNVRVQDIASNWSMPFKTVVKVDQPLTTRSIKIIEGEVSIDAAPPVIIIGMNGNFNEALESVHATLLSSGLTPGLHSLRVRLKGTDNTWGNYFTTSLVVSPCYSTPMPTVSTSGPLAFCNGSSVTLTANSGFTSYTWLRNNQVVGNSASLVATVSGNYTVIVTDSSNCPNSSIPKTVTVHTPVATINPLPTLCQGSIDTLKAGTGYVSYQWSAGSNTNAQLITSSGTYTVTVTDVNGCTDAESITITSISQPSAPVISASGPTQFCPGGNVILSTNATGNFHWNNGSNASSLFTDSSGTYSVIVTGANGCTNSTSISTVRYNQAVATIQLNGPSEYCINSPSLLTANLSQQYQWSNNATARTITPLISGVYSVTITDNNGCTATSSPVSIIVNQLPPTPVVTASGPLSFCNGGSVVLQSSTLYQHIWNNGSTASSQTITESIILVDTVINQYGCKSWSDSIIVDVHPKASITVSGPTVMCYGDQVTLTAHPNIGVRYEWQNGSTANNITLNTSTSVSVIVTETGTGCSDTAYTQVIVNPLPTGTVAANGPTTVCAGSGVTIEANGTAHTKFQWFYNGSPITYTVWSLNCNCYQTYNVYGPTYFATSTGNYKALVIDTLTGCTQFTNEQAITIQYPPKPSITANGGTTLCIGANTLLSSTPASSYLWSTGDTTATTVASTQGYYYVITTDNLGCINHSDSTYVSFHPVAVISANGPTTFCQGGSVSLTAGPSGSYVWNTGSTSSTIANINQSGTYTVSVTDNNGCTSISAPVAVVVNPLPTGTITAVGGTTICSGNSVLINVNGSTHTIAKWYFNGSPLIFPFNYYPYIGYSLDAAWQGTYSVQLIDTITGCTSMSNSIAVTVLSLPQVHASLTSTIKCYGGSDASLLALASGTVGPYQYQWNTGVNSNILTNVNAGTYIISATDNFGCTNRDTIIVTQPTAIAPIATSPANTGGYNVSCANSTDGVALVSAGGTAPYTYQWSNGATSNQIIGLAPGTYTVTVTDNNLCVGTSSVTLTAPTPVSVSLVPSIYIGGHNVSCSYSTDGSITAHRNGGVGKSHFVWSNGDTSTTIGGLAPGNYTITAYDSLGCYANGSITLTAPSILSASLTSPDINGYNLSCSNSHDGQIYVSVSGGNAGYSYAWNDTSNLKNRVGLDQGIHTLIVSDTNGCVDTNSIVLTAPDTIVLQTTGDILNCFGLNDGSTSVVASGGVGPYSYLWDNGSADVYATNLYAGIYYVVVTDSRGCTMQSSATVTQPQELIGYAFGTYIDCGSQIGLLSITATGGLSPYQFNWSNGSTAAFQVNQPPGNYSVIVTDSRGCLDTTYAIILNPPDLFVTVNNGTVLCEQSTNGSLHANVTGGVAPYLYLWNTGATTATINNVGVGSYTVTITDGNGCTKIGHANIIPDIVINNQLTTSTSCTLLQPYQSIAVSSTGGTIPYTYQWNTGAHTSSIINIPSGWYTVTTTDMNGCKGTDSIYYTAITITVHGDTTFCHGDSLLLSVNAGSSYYWNTGDTTASTYVKNSGIYTAQVGGCYAINQVATLVTYCYQQVNLRVFIQGFYDPSTDSMVAVLDPVNLPNICDSLTLSLADADDYQIVSTDSGVIDRAGYGSFDFTGLLPGHRYYIVVRHRNSIETWSKQSFMFLSPITTLDFTHH